MLLFFVVVALFCRVLSRVLCVDESRRAKAGCRKKNKTQSKLKLMAKLKRFENLALFPLKSWWEDVEKTC